MFPLSNPPIDRAANVAVAGDQTLNVDTGLYYKDGEGQMIYTWGATGKYGAAVYVPDVATTLNDWADDGASR